MLSDIVLKRPMRQLSTGCRIVYVRNYMETSGPSQGDHVRQRVAQIVGSLLRSSYNHGRYLFIVAQRASPYNVSERAFFLRKGNRKRSL